MGASYSSSYIQKSPTRPDATKLDIQPGSPRICFQDKDRLKIVVGMGVPSQFSQLFLGNRIMWMHKMLFMRLG